MTAVLHLHRTGEAFIGRMVPSQQDIDEFAHAQNSSNSGTPETKPERNTHSTATSGNNFVVTADNKCLRPALWEMPSTTLHLGDLKAGCPVSFWLDAEPRDPMINGVPFKIKKDYPLSCISYLMPTMYLKEQDLQDWLESFSKLVEADTDPSLSFYLGFASTQELIPPFLKLYGAGSKHLLARIHRSMYSRQIYTSFWDTFRKTGTRGRQAALDELLGVDLSSDKVSPLPPLFQRDGEPEHCSTATINTSLLQEYTKTVSFVHFATKFVPDFSPLVLGKENDFVERIEAFRKDYRATPASIVDALQLPSGMSLDDFMLYNIVEALLYSSTRDRVDDVAKKSKLPDLGREGIGKAMIADYVRSRYAADYKQRLKHQLGREQKILQRELIRTLLEANSEDFADMLTTGHARGVVAIQLDKENSAGFQRLHKSLLDLKNDKVVDRAGKLYMIYSGRTMEGERVFNGGNLLRRNWDRLQKVLSQMNETEVWDRLQQERLSRVHVYRDEDNRHGHDNDKPSYAAFGCLSLDEYRQRVDDETWNQYIKDHPSCCGMKEYLAAKKKNAAEK